MKLASLGNEACFVGQRSLLRFWDKFCVNTDNIEGTDGA